MKYDLDIIKKKYGENFARLCRTLFPTILETKGKLTELLEKHFMPSKYLYEDIINSGKTKMFQDYIIGLTKKEVEVEDITETPEELFEKAGYVLFKCKNNEDVLKFKKYYKGNEELCTFRDPYRIKNYHIFWAVKKNVDEIKRENFLKPERQDEYGTSVISIQFSKDVNSTISIKNRYNHTVNNPDATFSNNLENIHKGLTNIFWKFYNLNFINKDNSFKLPNYVLARDGKFYRYNNEINNVYFCANNVVIKNGGEVCVYDKSRYEIIDYFLLDKREKTIKCLLSEHDSFVNNIKNIYKIEIKKIENSTDKLIEITKQNLQKVYVTINKYNNIIGYTNDYVTTIGKNFLSHNSTIKEFNAKKLKFVKDSFLYSSEDLEILNIPNVEIIGDSCLGCNDKLQKLDLPKVKSIGNGFLYDNRIMTEFNAPNLEILGDSFHHNELMAYLNLPKLEEVGDYFFDQNKMLKKVNLPSLKKVGNFFLGKNNSIKKLDLPSLEDVGICFMEDNNTLKTLNVPKLKDTMAHFLVYNQTLKNVDISSVMYLGEDSFRENRSLKKLYFPNLKVMDSRCFFHNNTITEFDAPKLNHIGNYCFENNMVLEKINLPKLKYCYSSKINEKRIEIKNKQKTCEELIK